MSFPRLTVQPETDTTSVNTTSPPTSPAQTLPTTSNLSSNLSIALSQALLSSIARSPSNADVATNVVIAFLGYGQALSLAASGQVRWARRRLKDVWYLVCVCLCTRARSCALVRVLLHTHMEGMEVDLLTDGRQCPCTLALR